ncbi:class I SAM-dependent methyltransferase [Micromonospora sp. CPCC 205371]|nr:class I SAM-dependent methyltransferase [Micromonospora sp. CPCC 205371]
MVRDALGVARGVGTRPPAGGRLPRPVIEIVERDDGLITGVMAAGYLAEPDQWPAHDRRALDLVHGRVLDVGVGAGRAALALQERGVPVTGLDISPGAIAVCRARGVRELAHASVEEHAAAGQRYDTFLLLGNNLGLLEGRERAPGFLDALARMASPGARVIAQGTDPYGTTDPVQVGYHKRNREHGRFGGQLRLRLRYRELATDWFDYLVCSVDELSELLSGTGWELSALDDTDAPYYLATLEHRNGRRV